MPSRCRSHGRKRRQQFNCILVIVRDVRNSAAGCGSSRDIQDSVCSTASRNARCSVVGYTWYRRISRQRVDRQPVGSRGTKTQNQAPRSPVLCRGACAAAAAGIPTPSTSSIFLEDRAEPSRGGDDVSHTARGSTVWRSLSPLPPRTVTHWRWKSTSTERQALRQPQPAAVEEGHRPIRAAQARDHPADASRGESTVGSRRGTCEGTTWPGRRSPPAARCDRSTRAR